MSGSHEQLNGGLGYIEKLFTQPFREDVFYHGIPAMAVVGLATTDEFKTLGLEQSTDVRELRYKVGILVDERKECVFATTISDSMYKVMEEEAEKNPDEQWVDIKRRIFLDSLTKQDADVKVMDSVSFS